MTKMAEFITHYKHPSAAINVQMQAEAKRRMEENQLVIESLLRGFYFVECKVLPCMDIRMIR